MTNDEHEQLLSLAERCRLALEAGTVVKMSAAEFSLLKNAGADDWDDSLRQVFSESLPHVAPPMPWEAPGSAAFGSLPVVVVP